MHHQSNQTIYKGTENLFKYLQIVDKQFFWKDPHYFMKISYHNGHSLFGYNRTSSRRISNSPPCFIRNFNSRDLDVDWLHEALKGDCLNWQLHHPQFYSLMSGRRTWFLCPCGAQISNYDSQCWYDEMWWKMWECETSNGGLSTQIIHVHYLNGLLGCSAWSIMITNDKSNYHGFQGIVHEIR
jgi:hypothetical protein